MQIRTESGGVVLTLYREDLADADVHGLMERMLIQLAERPGFVILNVDVETITEVGVAALARMRWVLHERDIACFTLAPAGVMDILKRCRMVFRPPYEENSGRRWRSWSFRRATMPECIWLTRDSERPRVFPISFIVSSS